MCARRIRDFMMVDNKKKMELLITGGGIIILIFLIANHMPRSKNNKTISKTEPYPTSDVAIMVTYEVGSEDNIRWGRDPFLLDVSNVQEQGMEGMVLNGIVADKEKPYAIINNDIVKMGDKVSGMTVIEINEKNVVLDENGQRHTLELNLY